MFCREQAARFGDRLSDIRDAGADLYAIGSGATHFAQSFKDDFNIAYDVYTDEPRATYQALGLKRDRLMLVKPSTFKNAKRTMSAGFRQGRVMGDVFQLGGTLVITPDDDVRFVHTQNDAGQHADPSDVVAALT